MLYILTKTRYVDRLEQFLKKEKIKHKIFTKFNQPEKLGKNYDLGVSYCWIRLVKEPDLSTPKYGWVNYHPAPLPKYKGGDPYTQGVKNKVTKWAVTAHKMKEAYDEGQIYDEIEIDLDYPPVTKEELGAIAHHYCFQLFKDTISMYAKGDWLYPPEMY